VAKAGNASVNSITGYRLAFLKHPGKYRRRGTTVRVGMARPVSLSSTASTRTGESITRSSQERCGAAGGCTGLSRMPLLLVERS
jgi:hypothetical protein